MGPKAIGPGKRRLKSPGVTLERLVQPRDRVANIRIQYGQRQLVLAYIKEPQCLTLRVADDQRDGSRGSRTSIAEHEVVPST